MDAENQKLSSKELQHGNVGKLRKTVGKDNDGQGGLGSWA
jgi:hypothetical protein